MLVDDYEQYQNKNNDRTDVVVVSRSGSEEPEQEQQPEPEPLANDRTTPRPSYLLGFQREAVGPTDDALFAYRLTLKPFCYRLFAYV